MDRAPDGDPEAPEAPRRRPRPFAAPLLFLGLALLLGGLLVVDAYAPPPRAEHPDVGPDTTIDDLWRLVREAPADERAPLLEAYADLNRPTEGVVERRSRDGALHVVIGANGRAGAPDGEPVELLPGGARLSAGFAGHGAPSLLGTGGAGGDLRVWDAPPPGASVVGRAGAGGSGAWSGGPGGVARAPAGAAADLSGGPGGDGGLHGGRAGGATVGGAPVR